MPMASPVQTSVVTPRNRPVKGASTSTSRPSSDCKDIKFYQGPAWKADNVQVGAKASLPHYTVHLKPKTANGRLQTIKLTEVRKCVSMDTARTWEW